MKETTVYRNAEIPMTIINMEVREEVKALELVLESTSGKITNVLMEEDIAKKEFNEGIPNQLQILTLQDHTGNIKAISPLNWYQIILSEKVAGDNFDVGTMIVRAVFPAEEGILHIRGSANGMVDVYIKEGVYREAFPKGLPSNSSIAILKDEKDNVINISMILWTPVMQVNPNDKSSLHGYLERTRDYRV